MGIAPSYIIPLGIRAISHPMTNLLTIEAGTVSRGSIGAPLTCDAPRKSNSERLANSRLHI